MDNQLLSYPMALYRFRKSANQWWDFTCRTTTVSGIHHRWNQSRHLNDETDRLNFADNGTGRMLLYDSGLNQLHSHSNGTGIICQWWSKFRTDVFGTITSGRHAVYGNLDMYTNKGINTRVEYLFGQWWQSSCFWWYKSWWSNKMGKCGDSDTGLRSSSDGTLEIMSNNGAVGIIRNGRMGVNTSNPLAPLHVTWQNSDFDFCQLIYDYTGLSFYNEGGMHWINNNANNPLLLGDPNNGPALTHRHHQWWLYCFEKDFGLVTI